jgi:tight adherence protein B
VLQVELIAMIAMLAGAVLVVRGLATTRKARQTLKQHVNLVAPAAYVAPATRAVTPAKLGTAIKKPLQRIFAVGIPYTWGMQTNAIALLAIAGVAATLTWLAASTMFAGSRWLPPLLGACAGFLLPRFLLIRRQRMAERKFIDLFPGSIDMMVRMLRAGMPIPSAVRAGQTETPPPLNRVYGSIADQVALGVPFEKALDEASERIGLPDFRFFAVALKLQAATGGNLATTLENLAETIRMRRALRLKAAAATAEVRVSAYVLGALPVVTIGALLFLQPGYVAPLFYDARGKYILGMAGALLLLALLSMRQMMRRATQV